MKVDVKLFARAKDLAGADSIQLDVSDQADVAEVRRALAERIPALSGLAPRLLVAVETEYASDATPVGPGLDVACFPPVSGG